MTDLVHAILSDWLVQYGCPWTGGVCMRTECYGKPRFEGFTCDLCGRELCEGERWELVEIDGVDKGLCFPCYLRWEEIKHLPKEASP